MVLNAGDLQLQHLFWTHRTENGKACHHYQHQGMCPNWLAIPRTHLSQVYCDIKPRLGCVPYLLQ